MHAIFRPVILLLELLRYIAAISIGMCAAVAPLIIQAQTTNPQRPPEPHVILVDTTNLVARFDPSRAFGAGLDGLEFGDISRVYTRKNIESMLSAGFRPISYRLRTELANECWHWNPTGSWSDGKHQQGYWTSSTATNSPILTSNGYRLPRRGNTIDQANNDGYSRILDGDINSFWKSNPYLDKMFTHEPNTLHPQWVAIDLGKVRSINAIELHWSNPFAIKYKVQYSVSVEPDGLFDSPIRLWRTFPGGDITHGHGGESLTRLSDRPIRARFVRLMLLASSYTAPAGATDVRDRLGFALSEVRLGYKTGSGRFHDVLRHGKSSAAQSTVYVSSTDPWHRASDLDPNVEQPGIDRLFHSGILAGTEALMPAAPLYDTPENSGSLVRYLMDHHYPVAGVEIGEEPDGQHVLPEDFASLYIQWARAIRLADPQMKLGGPSLECSVEGYLTWANKSGNGSWLNRFVRYLNSHRATKTFNFFSFEWYPFDDTRAEPRPEESANLLRKTMASFEADGISKNIPWIISEYGYSSFAGRAEVDLPGAIVDIDTAALFLSLGGAASYYYGTEPAPLMNEASPGSSTQDSWGNLALFLSDDDRKIMAPTAAYRGAKLLTKEWVQPGGGVHRLYSASTDMHDKTNSELLSAYPVQRPDGLWSVLILNKSRTSVEASLRFVCSSPPNSRRFDEAEIHQFGPTQYVWRPNGRLGSANPNSEPKISRVSAHELIELPPLSITVVTGALPRL